MRYLSLFSGVGGFDLGADAAGWSCVGQVEWDPWCRKVLDRHWPNVPKWSDVRDARAVGGGPLQPDGGTTGEHPAGRRGMENGLLPCADVIAGGFPCQDVSVAGNRAGMGQGTRSGLYAEIIRIVREMRDATFNRFPRWVILENVVGLLSVDDGAGFRAVLRDLADVGAHLVEWAVVDSQWFGVPQRRRRVFIVACFDPATARSAPDPLFPVGPRLRRDTQEGDQARQDVAGTLGGGSGRRGWAPDTDRMTFVPALATRCGNTLDDQRTGQLVATGFHMTQTPISGPVAPAPGATSGGTGVAYPVARRGRTEGAEWEIGEPDIYNSLRAGDGSSSRQQALITPDYAVRRLTPLECERLQGWPDGHTALTADGTPIADSHRYRMAGNGITAPVAEWVCRQLDHADGVTV